jgi:hypothetical protein
MLELGTPGASLGAAGNGMGGGVFNQGGIVVVSNTTITGNTARGGDAPADNPGQAGGALGGGVFNLNGSLTLTSSTFANNAVEAGATAFIEQVAGEVIGSELVSSSYGLFGIAGATATETSTVTVTNSIFAHTGAGSAITVFRQAGSSTFNATGPNIVFGILINLGGVVSGIKFMNSDPSRGLLSDNGGLTPSMLPQEGSPAIDAGSNEDVDAFTSDQRGRNFIRIFNRTVDIGAVESQPKPPLVGPFLSGGSTDGTVRLVSAIGDGFSLGENFEGLPGLGVNARTALADVTGDEVPDFIVAAGPGSLPRVSILEGSTKQAFVTFNAFEDTFRGGLFVAAGDLDGDGKAEVIVTPDRSGGPIVAIYRGSKLAAGVGGQDAQVTRFFGIDGDPNFRGGCRPALGDISGDGVPDLVIAAGVKGGPRIALFDGARLTTGGDSPPKLRGDFVAFESSLRNGSFVAAGDVNGDGRADLAFGGGPRGAPRVRLFDGAALLDAGSFANVDEIGSAQKANFFAGDPSLRGGVRLALRDADGNGRAELVTGSGEGEPSRVRVYTATNLLSNASPDADQELDPFGAVLANGVFVG